ncbi:glycosyltransferase family 2 protein [Aerococcus urinaeequi]|uniref:glycosyltransferase family 2 protein n=1 Tax=Aerococcus urinaeequi TaxID=51665 RepID=UPI003D6AA1F8
MSKPIISVIVPVYNASDYINVLLDSIMKQTFKNFEVLLVNDGSTDNSLDICEEYSLIDSRFKVINKSNGGVSSARNVGMNQALGEFITFADSDDYVSEVWLERLYSPLSTNSNIDFSMCDYFIIKGDKRFSVKTTYSSEILERDFIISQLIGNMLNSNTPYVGISVVWNKLYRKSFIGDLRFDLLLDHAEDWWFNHFLLDKARRIAVVNEELYYYCVLINSESLTKKFNIRKLNSLIYTYPTLIDYVKKYNIPIIEANTKRLNTIIDELIQSKISLTNNEFNDLIISLGEDCKFQKILGSKNNLKGLRAKIVLRFKNQRDIKLLISLLSIKRQVKLRLILLKNKIFY